MTAHALLSASGAHKWLNCPGSVSLEKDIADTSSVFAREGTLAHAVCELKVNCYTCNRSDLDFEKELAILKQDKLWDDEMLETAQVYFDYIHSLYVGMPSAPLVLLERRVDFSRWVPNGFGTADCIMISGEDLYIIDYKHGKGVEVSAVDNPQMKLYALGALNNYGFVYDIKAIHMAIIQPRINNISEWDVSRLELEKWGRETVKPIAKKAYEGCEEYAAGEHCRFCRAKQMCKARAEHFMQLYPEAEKNFFVGKQSIPGRYTKEDLAEYLKKGALIKTWYEDISEYALAICLNGDEVPGYKAVEGRSTRKFTDQDKAFDALISDGIAKEVLYNYVPLTLAQAEKVVGKKKFNELVGDYVSKEPGKPTLVLATDKRAAISNVVKAANVFEKLED